MKNVRIKIDMKNVICSKYGEFKKGTEIRRK
jgi:hypothetical protein